MKRFLLAVGAMALTGALFTTTALAANNVCSGSGTCTGGSILMVGGNKVCEISGKTISGGLTVTGPCILDNDTVTGGIKINSGDLEACGSAISGGIQGTGAAGVGCVVLGLGEDDTNVSGAVCAADTISGGIQLQDLNGNSATDLICRDAQAVFEAELSTITGGVQIKNSGMSAAAGLGSVELESDIITGGVQLDNNELVELDNGAGDDTAVNCFTGTDGNCITGGIQLNNNLGIIVNDNGFSGGLSCSGNSTVLLTGTGNVGTGGKNGQCAGF